MSEDVRKSVTTTLVGLLSAPEVCRNVLRVHAAWSIPQS